MQEEMHRRKYMDIDADAIRHFRHSNAFSQYDLALESGLCVATIENVEKGSHRPRPKTVRLIATALGVKPRQLVKKG